ncbi:MAG: DUF58 domain-containing protein [Planctomycetaceae bacterium]|nr:DUF58 domain-containing protein [Planctomycetaceae bacterium]
MPSDSPTVAPTDYQFEIAVRRLADDLRFGQDASLYVGAGIDYVQSRPFEQGDSIRDLDWRVSARAGRFYVKQYESLKSMAVYLLVDTSASMAFHSTPLSKHFLAMLLTGGLGLAALNRLSPVGLMGCGERQLHFKPSLNRGQIFLWLHDLRRSGFQESTQLADRVNEVQAQLKHRSLVIVISDLHDPEGIPALKKLAQKHDVAAIQILDPAEKGRLRAGLISGQEAETGTPISVRSRTDFYDLAAPGRELKSAGIDHLLLATDQPFVPPLRRFLADRGGITRGMR